MRRLPLTGLLLLPVAGYLLLSAERGITRRPAAEPSLKPRPRWTPSPSETANPLPDLSGPVHGGAVRPSPSASVGSAPLPLATPRTTTSIRASGSIPSIDAEGLLAALTRAGLECSVVSLDSGRLTWTCSVDTPQASYLVVVNGARTDAITRLQATVSRAESDFLAVRFLAGMAGLTYAGAEPARAADWVKRNISGGDSIRIGPVQFALSGAPGARSLDVVAVGGQP
jgi:hypothetical protein